MKKYISLIILYYLRFFARLQLTKIRTIQKFKKQSLTIIGITGSAGKTSCLLICEAALKPNFIVKTNHGYNSESGLPLSILNLTIHNYSLIGWLKILILAPIKFLTDWHTYQILILEMGIDSPYSPKNMGFLLNIVTPDIGIFLNVTSVHLQEFSSLENIAMEKAKLVNSSKLAIITTDPLVQKFTTNPQTTTVSPIHIDIKGYHLPPIYDTPFAIAIALGEALKIKKQTIIKNIQDNFTLPPSRATILEGINSSTIIDSSYNSSLLSTSELLSFLSTFKTNKIAILGDMREIGTTSSLEHQKLYKVALKSADTIISVGPETLKNFGSKALKFSFWWQAVDYLKNNLPPRSTILIKGSQNTIFLEEVVKSLLKNPKDVSKICRQSPYWLKIKTKYQNEHETRK